MNMRELFGRLTRRTPSKSNPRTSVSFDWTNSLSPRDWADLPTHHPRNESDAL
jgi:hypothetical protein